MEFNDPKEIDDPQVFDDPMDIKGLFIKLSQWVLKVPFLIKYGQFINMEVPFLSEI